MKQEKFVVGYTKTDIENLFNQCASYVNYSELRESEKNNLFDILQILLNDVSITFHIVEHLKWFNNELSNDDKARLISTFGK